MSNGLLNYPYPTGGYDSEAARAWAAAAAAQSSSFSLHTASAFSGIKLFGVLIFNNILSGLQQNFCHSKK